MIDLRSDTVTKPTPAMRKAMAEAEVGDDVYSEDPTVNRLQERAAEIFGKEAALFVPTGCMGNQIAVKLHTNPGEEVIIEERSHILYRELGASAIFSGITFRTLRSAASTAMLTWEEIEPAITKTGPYYDCRTGLICIENSHNFGGGSVMTSAETNAICDGAHRAKLPVHIDGARIFNAAIAVGETVDKLSEKADSVQFCLSKGLGAPVGSILTGRKDFIEEARVWRKRLGGGMRQVGVLAAAGLVALEETPKTLHLDHQNAKRLAEGIAGFRGVRMDPETVRTNILIFDVSGTGKSPAEICALMKDEGVLASPFGASVIRMVTHYDVSSEDVETALKVMGRIFA